MKNQIKLHMPKKELLDTVRTLDKMYSKSESQQHNNIYLFSQQGHLTLAYLNQEIFCRRFAIPLPANYQLEVDKDDLLNLLRQIKDADLELATVFDSDLQLNCLQINGQQIFINDHFPDNFNQQLTFEPDLPYSIAGKSLNQVLTTAKKVMHASFIPETNLCYWQLAQQTLTITTFYGNHGQQIYRGQIAVGDNNSEHNFVLSAAVTKHLWALTAKLKTQTLQLSLNDQELLVSADQLNYLIPVTLGTNPVFQALNYYPDYQPHMDPQDLQDLLQAFFNKKDRLTVQQNLSAHPQEYCLGHTDEVAILEIKHQPQEKFIWVQQKEDQ